MERAPVVSIAGRCHAITRSGRPCRNRAVDGTTYCRTHTPAHGLSEAGRARPAAAVPGVDDFARVVDFLRRRLRGDYEVDDFGFDHEVSDLLVPASYPMTDLYWRAEVVGAERVPASGAALLAANHAGTIPIDGIVLRALVLQHTQRHMRMLMADLGFELPFISHLARKTGITVACPEDALRLLHCGELVGVFPEGYKGIGKGWRERYRLQRFGRGGFVEVAIRSQTPIVPVAIVGSEETYPMIANIRPLARLFGFPYFPLTPFFPMLGPLGLVPLPSKWIVEFCEPVRTDHLEPDDADDPVAVLDVTDRVRHAIQESLLANLKRRRTIFG